MLKNEICQDSLFMELEPFAKELGMTLVDVQKHIHGKADVQVAIVVSADGRDTTVDDCEKFHRTVQPRLELLIGRDELSMEVSTPGLQRNLRDVWEFSVFNGKRCRIYDSSKSTWIEGTIDRKDKSVFLKDWIIEDSGEKGDLIEIEYDNIQKAKLEYKFENKKSGDKLKNGPNN